VEADVTNYYLVTEESLARSLCGTGTGERLRAEDTPCADHREFAAAILDAHPREAADTLMAVIEVLRALGCIDPMAEDAMGQKCYACRALSDFEADLRERMEDGA
jgi:hypothetical protein